MIEVYPLQWPVGYPRTKYPARSKFRETFASGRYNIKRELELLGAKDVFISTNVPIRNDGFPFASYKMPEDKGVAVYFTLFNNQCVFACDKWDKIEHNMKAVMLTIEALRGIDRWGVSEMLKRSFTGFKALPASAASTYKAWWEVLMVSQFSSEEVIKSAYRSLAKQFHPDINKDNPEYFNIIKNAYEEGIKQVDGKI